MDAKTKLEWIFDERECEDCKKSAKKSRDDIWAKSKTATVETQNEKHDKSNER